LLLKDKEGCEDGILDGGGPGGLPTIVSSSSSLLLKVDDGILDGIKLGDPAGDILGLTDGSRLGDLLGTKLGS